MNDGTNIASDDIILKPKFRYWLMKNFLLITLAIFVFIFSKYIREHELLKFISGTILVLLNLTSYKERFEFCISIVDIYNFLQIYFNVTLYKMDYN